jgi:hypothetical protein
VKLSRKNSTKNQASIKLWQLVELEGVEPSAYACKGPRRRQTSPDIACGGSGFAATKAHHFRRFISALTVSASLRRCDSYHKKIATLFKGEHSPFAQK